MYTWTRCCEIETFCLIRIRYDVSVPDPGKTHGISYLKIVYVLYYIEVNSVCWLKRLCRINDQNTGGKWASKELALTKINLINLKFSSGTVLAGFEVPLKGGFGFETNSFESKELPKRFSTGSYTSSAWKYLHTSTRNIYRHLYVQFSVMQNSQRKRVCHSLTKNDSIKLNKIIIPKLVTTWKRWKKWRRGNST
jgi:hypothetical protein